MDVYIFPEENVGAAGLYFSMKTRPGNLDVYISRGQRALGIEMSIFLEENAPPLRRPRFSPSEEQNFDRVGVADPLVGLFPSDPLRETPRTYISRGKRALGIEIQIKVEIRV